MPSKKAKKSTRRLRKNITVRKKKSRTPTSLSVFPDLSPQLQKKGEPTKLTRFTSKNVSIRDSKGQEYNAIIDDSLAYRRAPRGSNAQFVSKVVYGPKVEALTKKNYKKLKKGTKIYYDRGSSVLRGPFIFQNNIRDDLVLKVKDAAYDAEYLFTISVNKLNKEKIYMATSKKSIKGRGTRRRRKYKRRRRRGTRR